MRTAEKARELGQKARRLVREGGARPLRRKCWREGCRRTGNFLEGLCEKCATDMLLERAVGL